MALPTDDLGWLNYLSLRHDSEMNDLEDLNRYYEGTQTLTYMQPDLWAEVEDRIKPVIIGWPQLVVDAVEERMDVEGFRMPDSDEADEDLWRVWQANAMDEQSQLAHVDALVMKRSYVSVGTNEKDGQTPLLCAESPLEMFADIDPRTREVRAALKRVIEEDSFARVNTQSATLYLPNATVWFEHGREGWKETNRDDHNLGEVPVVPIVNRGRLSTSRGAVGIREKRQQMGRSELSPIIPLSNAANKLATDMMVAAEFVALPIRGIFGVGPDDLEDQDGNKLTAMQTLYKRLLTIPDEDGTAKTFEFAGASLGGFHESLNSLASMVASLAGLPPHYLGFTTDNPASADAIRSAESRLVKRCERKQRPWGGSYERMCRIVKRFQTGGWDDGLKQLETIWRDPSTPTVAQAADAAIKLYQAPPGQKPILTLRSVRRRLDISDAEIKKMEDEQAEEDRKAAELDPVAAIAARMPTPPATPEISGANGG